MPKQRSPKRDSAYQLWLDSGKTKKLKDIAEELGISETQVRKWKNQDNWNGNVTNKMNGNVTKRKGGQPGNKNAVGHGGTGPPGNKNAEKYGFFSKFLPDETKEIFDAIEEANPLDLLWHQIQLAYAAIIRAQRIAYVKKQEEWETQSDFLGAQARAQGELRALIKQYDEMLHKNWDMATEEQRARIEALKARTKSGDQTSVEDKVQKLFDAIGGALEDGTQ